MVFCTRVSKFSFLIQECLCFKLAYDLELNNVLALCDDVDKTVVKVDWINMRKVGRQ